MCAYLTGLALPQKPGLMEARERKGERGSMEVDGAGMSVFMVGVSEKPYGAVTVQTITLSGSKGVHSCGLF